MNALRKRQGAIESLAAKAEGNRHESEELEKTYEERLREGKLPVTEERDGLLKEAHSASIKVIEEAELGTPF